MRHAWILASGDLQVDVLLVLAGLVTILPLIWFNVAARALRLTTIGFFQYIAPTLTFLLSVFHLWRGIHPGTRGGVRLYLVCAGPGLGRVTDPVAPARAVTEEPGMAAGPGNHPGAWPVVRAVGHEPAGAKPRGSRVSGHAVSPTALPGNDWRAMRLGLREFARGLTRAGSRALCQPQPGRAGDPEHAER